MPDPIHLLERLASAYMKYARSDALSTLGKFVALLLFSAVCAAAAKVPELLILILAGLAVAATFVFLSGYIYLLIVDRDALRSERYSITRTG